MLKKLLESAFTFIPFKDDEYKPEGLNYGDLYFYKSEIGAIKLYMFAPQDPKAGMISFNPGVSIRNDGKENYQLYSSSCFVGEENVFDGTYKEDKIFTILEIVEELGRILKETAIGRELFLKRINFEIKKKEDAKQDLVREMQKKQEAKEKKMKAIEIKLTERFKDDKEYIICDTLDYADEFDYTILSICTGAKLKKALSKVHLSNEEFYFGTNEYLDITNEQAIEYIKGATEITDEEKRVFDKHKIAGLDLIEHLIDLD